MSAELVTLNHCAAPFLSRATANWCLFYSTTRPCQVILVLAMCAYFLRTL